MTRSILVCLILTVSLAGCAAPQRKTTANEQPVARSAEVKEEAGPLRQGLRTAGKIILLPISYPMKKLAERMVKGMMVG